jgi:predicted MFS family arabinose efflux permease
VIRPSYILPIIIFSQFTGTSLWFAGNAIISDLQQSWALPEHSIGYVTSAVQLGFIVGTLVFAYLALADRFSPRKVFFVCSMIGATTNAALLVAPEGMTTLLLLRFVTGFFWPVFIPLG